jgi:hypothetical protein
MYISRYTSRFRQLGRFAPVADDSGLRPETQKRIVNRYAGAHTLATPRNEHEHSKAFCHSPARRCCENRPVTVEHLRSNHKE